MTDWLWNIILRLERVPLRGACKDTKLYARAQTMDLPLRFMIVHTFGDQGHGQ